MQKLTNESLHTMLKALVKEERKITTKILESLKEVEERRLYATHGYSSLFAYCVGELKYSEAAAGRRISAMRLIKKLPALTQSIQSGGLSLSNASELSYFLKHRKEDKTPAQALVQMASNTSTREVQKKLLQLEPKIKKHKEKQKQVSHELTEIKFYADEALMKKLNRLKEVLAARKIHSYSELIEYLADEMLKKVDPMEKAKRAEERKAKKATPTPAPEWKTRYIPKAIQHKVWLKNQGKCSYIHPKTQSQCQSSYGLEIDHITPYAKGGTHKEENLRLLCKAHNLSHAIQKYGEEKIRRYFY